jgi:hypothetical protein
VSNVPEATHWPAVLPTLSDFLVSPGFAGIGVLLAAIVVFCTVLYTSRRAARRLDEQLEQQDRHHQEHREDKQRSEATERCWDRVVWLIKTAGIEPAARDTDDANLGLGPEVALELLQGLHRDAKELGDDTLTRALTVYIAQYGLALGQQGGPPPPANKPNTTPTAAQTKTRATAEKPSAVSLAAAEANARKEGRHR